MILDVTRYQDELKGTAYRILKDQSLAEDMVQDTFLQALEHGIDDKGRLIEIVTKLSLRLYGERKRGVDTPQSGFYKPWEGEDEDPIWRKLPSTDSEVSIVINEEIKQALCSIKEHHGRYLPFVQAREFVRSLDLISNLAWKQYKNDNQRVNIPSNPQKVYRAQWKGWRDFLGNDFYTYGEFVNYVKTVLFPEGVNTIEKFKLAVVSLPKYIPASPDQVYKEEWQGWGSIFGSARKGKVELLTYEAARSYVQVELVPKGIDTVKIWAKRISEIPSFLPACPWQVYKGKGWINSKDFFGTDKQQQCIKRGFLPYKEAREWVRLNLRPLGITTNRLYADYMRGRMERPDLPPIPANLPNAPLDYYRNDGFSWGDYLGTLKISAHKVVRFSYRQCKEWIRNNLEGQVRTARDWRRYMNGESGGLPESPGKVPRYPSRRYSASKEWKGWDDFLGVVTVKKAKTVDPSERRKFRGKRQNFLSYEKARQYMIGFMVPAGIDTVQKYCRLENKPGNLPADPKSYYKGKGWVSASHFMGGDSRRKDKGYLSYHEAKEWIRDNFIPLGIDTLYKYRRNFDKLPDNMPPDPFRCYRARGWVDCFDFMGMIDYRRTRGKNFKNTFLSFEEACVWVKSNLPGVDGVKKWRLYTQGGFPHLPKLPPTIPVVPDLTYQNTGAWKGWGQFLSTGENRGRHMKTKGQLRCNSNS